MIRMQTVAPFLSRGCIAQTASRASEGAQLTTGADAKHNQTTKVAGQALLKRGDVAQLQNQADPLWRQSPHSLQHYVRMKTPRLPSMNVQLRYLTTRAAGEPVSEALLSEIRAEMSDLNTKMLPYDNRFRPNAVLLSNNGALFEFQNQASHFTVGELSIRPYYNPRNQSYLLGEGAYGRVSLVRSLDTGEPWAVKAVEDVLNLLDNEIELNNRLPDHPNVMKKQHCIKDGNTYYLVMPIAALGDGKRMGQILQRAQATLSSEQLEVINRWAVYSVFSGLQVLHDLKIAHLDIKPMNLLLSQDHLMVADLGNSHHCPDNQSRQRRGIETYMAPEQMNGVYDPFKSDIYSAGVTLLEILYGESPVSNDIVEASTQHKSVESHDTDPLKSLLRKLCDADPNARPSLAELLTDDCFLDRDPEGVMPKPLLDLLAPDRAIRLMP